MRTPLRSSELPENFISAMGLAATGVSVVTTDGPAGRYGLTVSAITSVSADPPMLLACVNRKSPAMAAIEANGAFAVNLLTAESRDVAETFAGRPQSGRPYDFDRHDWCQGDIGLPRITDALAVFECELDAAYDAGTHRIFVGLVVAAHRGASQPLVYCNRAFARVAAY
ncbi:flavin reductase family protein [soil metagenome]